MRLFGQVGSFSMTSVSQRAGSMLFFLVVARFVRRGLRESSTHPA